MPIVLVRIGDVSRIDLVKQALQAHAYWRIKGLTADLVIMNEDFSGYRAVLHDEIMGLVNAGPEASVIDKPGGVFVRRAEELSEEDRVLFQTVARVVLDGTVETFAEQVQRRLPIERLPAALEPSRQPGREAVERLLKGEKIFDNGYGGFTPDGREYVISLEPGQQHACTVDQRHSQPLRGHCGERERECVHVGGERARVAHNHLQQRPGERPKRRGLLPKRRGDGRRSGRPRLYRPRAVRGMCAATGSATASSSTKRRASVSQMTTYVAMDAPVKFVVVKLRNLSGRARRLSLTGYWELVLGEWRHTNLMHVVTERDASSGALLARNPYSRHKPRQVVFVQTSETRRSLTASRTEFIGRNGSLASPGRHAAGETVGQDRRRARPVCGCADSSRAGRRARERCRVRGGGGRQQERGPADDAAVRGSGRRPPGLGGRCGRTGTTCSGRRVCGDSRPRARRDGQRVAGRIRRSRAGSGGAAATTSRVAPTVSATSCRTPWPWFTRLRGSRASNC